MIYDSVGIIYLDGSCYFIKDCRITMESESESFERISILDKRDLLRSDRKPRKGHIEWVVALDKLGYL